MDVTIKQLNEFETTFGGLLRRVRAGLGVTSFGIAVFARVGPGQRRQLVTGEAGARMLLLGSAPGYVPPLWSEEGAGEIHPPEERRAMRIAQLRASDE